MRASQRKHRIGKVVDIVLLVAVLLTLGTALVLLGPPAQRVGQRGSSPAAVGVVSPTPTIIVPTPTAFGAPTGTPGLDPTPPPSVVLPPMTPVPPGTGTELQQKLQELQNRPTPPPLPTPAPSDPVNVQIMGARKSNTGISNHESTVIVIGTVTQVLPPRWTTRDGQRPANPQVPRIEHNIYTPVLVDVEQYLKGERPQKQLQLFAFGGKIGQDSFTMEPTSLYQFHRGERVVIFLNEQFQHLVLNGRPLWNVSEHYTITPDNHAVNYDRNIPVAQLLSEIHQVQQP
ncbi:MAG: hypothetical protein H0X37_19210 [Herpetosiphonaceae bacterium]|nr:hypothetical protein [Herpetosiphonaceae bacterium]